jgi:hypothetical protein
MASAIIDAFLAHCFLPVVGQLTFHVALWIHQVKKAASSVFSQAKDLKAELARRGLNVPKLSFLGKAKAVLREATSWSTASSVGKGLTDIMDDDHIVIQVWIYFVRQFDLS